jgi:hypothetical protein
MGQLSFRPDRSLDSIAPSSVSPQPFLVSEKRPKRDSELPVLIALVSGRKSAGVAQCIAP